MSEKDRVNNTSEENASAYNEDFSNDNDFAEITAEVPTASQDAPQDEPLPDAEYTYTSRKERGKVGRKGQRRTHKKGFRPSFVIIPAAAATVLLGLFLCLPFTLSKDAIASNVCSQDIDLGGLTVTEAADKLKNSYSQKNIHFSVGFNHDEQTETASFTSSDIDFSIDPDKTASEAYDFGRSDNIFKNSWDILCAFFRDRDIGMIPSYNEEALSDIFYNLGAKVYGYSKDAECLIQNNTLTITPPTAGQSHNVSDAVAEFNESVKKGIFQNIPITLKDNKTDKLSADDLYEKLSAEPKNAEYIINGNEVTITDHVVGVKIDKAKLAALVDQVNDGITGSIEVEQIMPEVTKEQLQQSLFGTTLASFSSNYSSSSANRAYNVELAASKINGIVLANGAEFSYNAVVGNANAANGFKMATVFSNGKVTEGIGGGVCQISSTLYCAVLRADLQVTERHNHSLPIGYVPGGQDATVSYGSLDFRFKNNTGAPIKIVATHSNRNVTISIVGSASAKKKVEVTSEKISSTEPTMTQIKDPSLPTGQTKVITKGKPGSVYMTYKRVYDANGALVSESKSKSTYKATPGEVAVGTGAAPSAPTSAQPQTPPAPSAEPEKPAQEPEPATQSSEESAE